MKTLLSLFGICPHSRLTFPQTPIRRSQFGTVRTGATYAACLDCGREFEAELGNGKLGAEIPREIAVRPVPASEAL